MAKAKYTYKGYDASKVKEHAEQSGGSFDSILKQGFDMFRPKNGENTIRILPPTWKDFDYWGYIIWVHNRIGSDESSYLCPAEMKGKPCPICDAAKEAATAGEKEEARQLKANKRYLVYLIDRDEKKPMPLVYSMSWSMDRDISALVHNKKSGKILPIDHPDDGMDVIFSKSGAGLKTKYYGYQIERETSPVSDNERRQGEIIDFVKENPLDEILNFYSAEYLGKVLEGKTEKKDELDEDDDDDKPKKRKARSPDEDEDDEPVSKKRRRAVEDDEDDEEDEDESAKTKRRKPAADDDDEEDDPPRKPRKRGSEDNDEDAEAKTSKRRRSADDEDEDEEPAPKKKKRVEPEDDEEEEKPRRSSRRVEADEDEDDEPVSKKRRRAVEDDEDDEDKPAKRVRAK